jgi:putative ABC transport system permease protein
MKEIFKTTYRNFTRNPITNLINLLGLSVSLGLVLVLSVYCISELNTDKYHQNGDRVYLYGKINDQIYMPAILKDQIDLNVPGIEASVRIAAAWETPVFQVEDKEPISSDILFADIDFFKLFTYTASEGNLETALKEPMTVVISKSLSSKLFGNTPALGKSIKMNNDKTLIVSAVVQEPKANSCLSFSALTSIASRRIIQPQEEEYSNWSWGNFQLFLLLKKGVSTESTIKNIYKQFPEDIQKEYNKAMLNPFRNLYFSGISLSGDNYLHSGEKKKVMILSLVATLVLIIALINFINITSSQWRNKIKQTGIMKVIGAKHGTILRNMLSESFILFLIALLLAIILVIIFVPFIKDFTGFKFNQQVLISPIFLSIAIVVIFVLSMLFSILPAFRISKSKTVDNLRKTVESHSTNSIFRGILVTAQFVIAIILIAFTILVQKQVNFGSSSFGLNKENIIGIKLTPQLYKEREVFRKTIEEQSGIKSISFTQYFPGKPISTWEMKFDINGENKILDFNTFCADASFSEMLGLELTSGRFYKNDLITDKNKVIVNETFVRQHKITNPIGAKFFTWTGVPDEIIGVVKDFHYKSVNSPIDPLAIRNESDASVCLVKLQSTDFNTFHKTIQNIKKASNDLSPSFPVEITFFDQAIENMYKSELQFRRIFSLFAISAILICCLGILAMSLFACQRRIKEIGIRKVNGAKVSEVLAMLSKDFVRWVAIAFIIATPIAYYAMNKWLENFAYKTTLSWWIFALTGLLALGIALITVSWQSWKAATRNPVEALRNE